MARSTQQRCQVDDLIVTIWSYQFFYTLQSDLWSEPNTVLLKSFAKKLGEPRMAFSYIPTKPYEFHLWIVVVFFGLVHVLTIVCGIIIMSAT